MCSLQKMLHPECVNKEEKATHLSGLQPITLKLLTPIIYQTNPNQVNMFS